LILKIENSQC